MSLKILKITAWSLLNFKEWPELEFVNNYLCFDHFAKSQFHPVLLKSRKPNSIIILFIKEIVFKGCSSKSIFFF